MTEETTKLKIMHVALSLFSKSGFTAVSIRDICRQVGIKESTVYYHFENKCAIFEELSQKFQTIAEDMMNRLKNAMTDVNIIKRSAFQAVSDVFFEKFLMDDFCNQFIRLMSFEQLNNEQVRQLHTKWMFREPLQFQSSIFEKLMEVNIIPSADSNYLAVKYYSPIFLYTQRYLLSGQLSEENKKEFRVQVDRHIMNFFKEFGGQSHVKYYCDGSQ